MYILVEACSDASFAATILFIKKLIDIIFIIGPVLLILLLTIDFTKAVIEGSEEKTKRIKDTAIKRILFAVALFFVPLIVDTSFGLLDKDKGNVISCYNKVDNTYVDSLAAKLEAETKEKEAQRQKTIEDIKAKQKSEAEKRANLGSNAATKKASKSSLKVKNIKGMESVCKDCSWSERIAQTAETLAWPAGTSKSVYEHYYSGETRWTSWSQLKKAKPTQAFMDAYDKVRPDHFKGGYYSSRYGTNAYRLGASCDVFAATVVRASGYDKNIPFGLYKQNPYLPSSKKWKKVSTAKRGDFCNINGHSMIYLGKNKVAEGGFYNKNHGHFGVIHKKSCKGYRIYRAVK